ncbi:MAG: pilus assembly protein [Alphaproteobacteria bacterium]|nr:pilus assembly protein [Alphaproteobacteria bacterium]
MGQMGNSNKRSLFRDARGTVAPIFGLLAIPALTAIAGALDMAGAYSTTSKLQNALDAATVASCGGGTGSQTTEEIVRAFLSAKLNGGQLTLLPAPPDGQTAPTPKANELLLENAEINPADGSVAPSLSTKFPTRLLKLIGIDDIDIGVSSMVICGSKRLELSLVLDVTGSMGDSVAGKTKIASMKEAAIDVLDIFDRNMTSGATRIALVPFSSSVNVGSLADSVRGTIANGNGQTVGKQEFMFRDKNDYNNWLRFNATSCVSERRGAQSYTDAAPNCTGNSCTAPVGHVYTADGTCAPGNEVVPLSANRTTLEQQINSYSPAGDTAGHVGTAWGWYMLSNKWASIFPAAAEPEVANPDELIKATIIMTDGVFNDQFYKGVDDDVSYNVAENGPSEDQFAALCAAMKDPDGNGSPDDDDSIVVYTVGFGITEGSAEGQRLKDCATDNTKYFFPYDGDELRAAFVTIGNELSGGQNGKAIVRN